MLACAQELHDVAVCAYQAMSCFCVVLAVTAPTDELQTSPVVVPSSMVWCLWSDGLFQFFTVIHAKTFSHAVVLMINTYGKESQIRGEYIDLALIIQCLLMLWLKSTYYITFRHACAWMSLRINQHSVGSMKIDAKWMYNIHECTL